MQTLPDIPFMKKLILTALFLISSLLYSFCENNENDQTDDYSWVYESVSIDPSDDMYYNQNAKYPPTEGYVQALKWRRNIEFNNASLDKFRLTQNTAIMPFYPFVYMPYGGFSLNRGGELGFLTRFDRIGGSELGLTVASHYSQNDVLQHYMGVEYPALLNHRMRLFGGSTVYTSAPQYQSLLHYEDESNFLIKAFNKIWSMVRVRFNDVSYTGTEHYFGVDFRIPLIEVNSVTQMKIGYRYVSDRMYKGEQLSLNENNLWFVIRQDFVWDKMRRTATIPVGNELRARFDFIIPTGLGMFGSDFRFKFSVEDKFYKKIYKEFYLAARVFASVNYNVSDNFSGEPFIRGYKNNELVGWASILANVEGNIPLVNADIKSSVSEKTLKIPAKLIIYLALFADFGVVFDNFDYPIDNTWYRPARSSVRNSFDPNRLVYLNVGGNNFFWPAGSLGFGLKVIPKFLHFLIRLDVAFNMTKSIIYQDVSDAFEISLSFSNAF